MLAVTTVGGNADVRACTENALRLLHAFGRSDIPVAEGAAGPLVGAIVRATEVHGDERHRDDGALEASPASAAGPRRRSSSWLASCATTRSPSRSRRSGR